MTVLYVIAFIAMIGLGYFGSGIVYGRGLRIKAPTPSAVITGSPVAGNPADTGRGIKQRHRDKICKTGHMQKNSRS